MNLGIGLSLTSFQRVPTVPLEDPDAAIAALFGSGEVGAWYDPSDSTTVFQDSKGVTPAGVGDPVGLILDKSKGGLSATELVTNGSFDNAAGWTEISGTLTISGGTATLAGTNQPDPFFVSASFSVNGGSWYKIQVDIVSAGGSPTNVNYIRLRTPGSFTGATGIVVPSATTGTRTAIVQIPAGWTTAEVCVQRGGAAIPPTTTLVVDNVSVKELPGNHATQTTSAARPILQQSGATPVLSGTELVTNGTFDTDTTGWSFQSNATGSVVSSELEVILAGSSSRAAYQDLATVIGEYYQLSLTARSASGQILFGAFTTSFASIQSQTVAATGSNQQLSLTFKATTTTTRIVVSQAETGSTETYYADNISVQEVTAWTGGLYYLDFDGVDDCLLMGDVFDDQIAVTTPGKWDLFVGAQIASDGTLIAKLGDSNHSESQRQYMAARFLSSKFVTGAYWSLGTTAYTSVQTDASYSYNTNYVFRTLFNRGLVANGLPSLLAGDRFAVRVDGADSSSTVYASNGNTDSIQNGTAQLSIGGAFGTSGPLAHQADMQMYGMVMFAGLNLDSSDTATVEAYLAAKSGVTL